MPRCVRGADDKVRAVEGLAAGGWMSIPVGALVVVGGRNPQRAFLVTGSRCRRADPRASVLWLQGSDHRACRALAQRPAFWEWPTGHFPRSCLHERVFTLHGPAPARGQRPIRDDGSLGRGPRIGRPREVNPRRGPRLGARLQPRLLEVEPQVCRPQVLRAYPRSPGT